MLPVDPKHKESCEKAIAILEEAYIVGNNVAIYDKRTGIMVTISPEAIPVFRRMLMEQRAGEKK